MVSAVVSVLTVMLLILLGLSARPGGGSVMFVIFNETARPNNPELFHVFRCHDSPKFRVIFIIAIVMHDVLQWVALL
jgi:hypothetical protein